MNTRKTQGLVAVLVLGLLAAAAPGEYLENFGSYTEGTILAERDIAGAEVNTLGGYHIGTTFSGDRAITVANASGHNYIYPSIRLLFWKAQEGSEITDAITANPIIVYELTYKWRGTNGSIGFGPGTVLPNTGGGSSARKCAFYFLDGSSGRTLTDAQGNVYSGSNRAAQNVWCDARFVINPGANSGDGTISVYHKASTDSVWTADAALQNINLHLSADTYVNTPSKWDCWLGQFLSGSTTYYAYNNIRLVRAYSLPNRQTVQGTVIRPGCLSDNASAAVTLDFRSLDGQDNLTRTVLLNPDGTFRLDNVPEGTYDIIVKASGTLSVTLTEAAILIDPVDLGTINLAIGDLSGDNAVNFEDFALLQNTYGRRGAAGTTPGAVLRHAVDGVRGTGEWLTWYSDPVADNGTGDVDLVGWAAEVENGVLYAAFELNPNGPTVAQYDDFQTPKFTTGHYLWAGLGIDVDPDTVPATGVAANNPFPVPLDICPELGMDQGGLLPTDPVVWNSLNLWGDGNDFAHYVPVTPVVAAYQGHVLEYAVPVEAIMAELPNTDGATPAALWKIGARLAAHGFGGTWDGDMTDLQSVPVAGDVQGKVTLQGDRGDNTTASVAAEFTPVTGGPAITRAALLQADGSFIFKTVPRGTYDVRIKRGTSLSAVVANVTVPADLGTIELANGDINGDDQVSFEDFSILQNNYGETGVVGNPLSAAAVNGCGGLGAVLISLLGLAILALRLRNE